MQLPDENEPKRDKNFTFFVGRLTPDEVDDLERAIEEVCGQINEDDWK